MTDSGIHAAGAPKAVGHYPHARRVGELLFLSGIGPRDPNDNAIPGNEYFTDGRVRSYDIEAQARRAFDNLKAVAEAAGGSLAQIVRLGLYLTDLGEFAKVNAVMQDYFTAPFPARSTIEVSGLPKGAGFEVDAVMVLV